MTVWLPYPPAASPLPPLMRVLVFQLLFWAWFAPYQWALWKPIKSEIVTAQLHAGWAGLFLETTWGQSRDDLIYNRSLRAVPRPTSPA